jgi:hypothetical protein
MKNINKILGLLGLMLIPVLGTAGNEILSRPDLSKSEIIAIDAVGDMLGDAGQIGVTVRDANGSALEGIAVSLRIESGDATLASVSGTTDAQGKFSSLLFSKVMTVATVAAFIDTDEDGAVDTRMNKTEKVAFIDSLMFTNGVGINIDTPDDSAVLHVNASDRGMLIPRVALQSSTDTATVINPATSLLVYNTNASDSLNVGYVYFNGSEWTNFFFID